MVYDLENFMRSCVEAYRKFIPGGAKLRPVATPFLDEGSSPAGAFDKNQPWLQCPFCCGRYARERFTEGKGDVIVKHPVLGAGSPGGVADAAETPDDPIMAGGGTASAGHIGSGSCEHVVFPKKWNRRRRRLRIHLASLPWVH